MDAKEAHELLAQIREIESHGPDYSIRDLRDATALADRAERERDRLMLHRELEKMGPISHQAIQEPNPLLADARLSSVLASKGWVPGMTAKIPVQTKALIDAPDDAAPRRVPGIVPEVIDSRFVYTALPTQDAGDATSIQAVVSQGRSLDADVKDVTSTDTKPTTTSATTLATFTMQRAATVSDYYPNAIVGLPEFRGLVDRDMTDAYRQAVDAYVVDELTTGAGTTDNSGSNLLETIRKAITNIQSLGFSPSLIAISPADAETLDLERTESGAGLFVLNPSPRQEASSPLWGARVMVGAGVVDPIVMDVTGVQLYIGTAQFAADSLTEFDSNQTRFRLESPVLLVVRQPGAIQVVSGS